MKLIHTSIVVAALSAAVVAAWWLQNRPAGGALQAGSAASAPTGGASAGGGAPGGAGGPGGPVAVEVGRVERLRLEDDATAVGSLRAHQGVMLRPEVSGRIATLSFADGQRVRRGQLLVQLDDTLQRAQLQQAEAQASIARTNLQRSRELLAQGFVSQSSVDQNVSALEVAQAQVALAQAQLARMKIVAPFDGVAGIRNVAVGDYVKDGADLVSVEDLSSLWVDFRLPERLLTRLSPGQAVEVALDAMPGKRFEARVAALDAQLDASGRSVLVRARLANSGGLLRGGMFARTRVVFSVRDEALVVPEEALVPQGAKQFVVKVVDGAGGAKTAQRVEVRVGQRVLGKAEVLDGLKLGDAVVLAGQARLMRGDGQALRIVDLDRPRGAGAPGRAASAASAAAAGSRASAPASATP